MQTRNDFGHFLNACGLLNVGVEVGVFAGRFSETLLSTWEGRLLIGVDCWGLKAPYRGRGGPVDGLLASEIGRLPPETQKLIRHLRTTGQSREMWIQLFNACQIRLKRFGDRTLLRREFSIDAANSFEDGSLDFVYIDANHQYKGITEDLKVWWAKVKIGGLMSGHDYVQRPPDFEVKRAVDEFIAANGITGLSLTEEPQFKSWYFFKVG